jgi:uncharacterized C2H2 Zn-finger protein
MDMSEAHVNGGDSVVQVRVSKWMAKLGWLQIPKEIRRQPGLMKVKVGENVYDGRLDARGRLFCKEFKSLLRESLTVEVKPYEGGYDVSLASEQSIQKPTAVEQPKVEEKRHLKCPFCQRVLYSTDSEFKEHVDKCRSERFENAKALLERLKVEMGFREGSKIFLREHGELIEVSEQEAIEYLMRENNIHRLIIENPPFPRLEMKIDAKLFMDFLKLVNEFNDDVIFKATFNGLAVKMMNPSHVTLIDAIVPVHVIDEYELTSEFYFTLNVKEVLRSFKPRRGDKCMLTVRRSELLKISCGNVTKRFEQPDIELEDLPPLKLDLGVYFIVPTAEVYRILSSISDEYTVKVSVTENAVQFKGKNSEGLLDSQVLLDKSGYAESSYSMNYLISIFKHFKNVAKIVKVEFAKDKPMRITSIEPINLTVYIAPYIE